MQVYRSIIAATFGRGAINAFEAALIRLIALFLLSSALGIVLAQRLPPFFLHGDISIVFIWAAEAFVVQMIVLCGLGVAYGLIRPTADDTLARLLLILPLQKVTRWAALLLPGLVLTCLVLSFAIPLVYVTFAPAANFLGFLTTLFIGIVSGLGYVYGFSRYKAWMQVIMILAVGYAEYFLLIRLHHSPPGHTPLLEAGALMGCFGLGALLLARSYSGLVSDVLTRRPEKRLIGATLPSHFWFIKKLCRAQVTKASWWTALVICIAVAGAAQKTRNVDPDLLNNLVSLMAAGFAADARAATRRWQPPEIVTQRGTPRFVYAEAGAATILTLLAICPLVIVILLGSGQPLFQSVFTGLHILLGVAAGLCAGTFCAPAARDISAQSAAALLAAAILTALESSLLNKLAAVSLIALLVCLTAALFIVTIGTELKRNMYHWRKAHV